MNKPNKHKLLLKKQMPKIYKSHIVGPDHKVLCGKDIEGTMYYTVFVVGKVDWCITCKRLFNANLAENRELK